MPYSDEGLKKVLGILNSQSDYRSLKQDLDNYFPDSSWADMDGATSEGSFARAFTLEGAGWLTTQEIALFWNCVDIAPDPAAVESLNSTNDLYGFLLNKINYWKNPTASTAASTAAATSEDATDVEGENYWGWKQRWESAEGVWKYSNGGPWMESHLAFPPVAPASRIFRVSYSDGTERTFLADGSGEREVWPWNPSTDPSPNPPYAYYDSLERYDATGAAVVAPHTPATTASVQTASAASTSPDLSAEPEVLRAFLEKFYSADPSFADIDVEVVKDYLLSLSQRA